MPWRILKWSWTFEGICKEREVYYTAETKIIEHRRKTVNLVVVRQLGRFSIPVSFLTLVPVTASLTSSSVIVAFEN